MNPPPIRLEQLPPMRVALFRALSASPERDAWGMLQQWAGPKGLLSNLTAHPVFGFNNPAPSPHTQKYGYEFWIRVSPDAQSEGGIAVKDFPGGLYAVTTCRLQGDPAGSIGDVWTALWEWTQTSPYRWRPNHELEKPHNPLAAATDMVFDLYLPICPRSEPSPVIASLQIDPHSP
jgi:DNA gyrase inhibitor GyrI